MSAVSRCPGCGAALPEAGPAGLFPSCLIRQGVNQNHSRTAAPGPSAGSTLGPAISDMLNALNLRS